MARDVADARLATRPFGRWSPVRGSRTGVQTTGYRRALPAPSTTVSCVGDVDLSCVFWLRLSRLLPLFYGCHF